jgi:nitroreductase
MKNVNGRNSEYDIGDIFLKRYSPRAMSGESISKSELLTLLEAAHWAPSASNIQPWRFLYALKGTKDFDLFFSFLKEGNKIWCKNGSALIIELSKKNTDDGKTNNLRSFDSGGAWENLALQGTLMNLVVHGMAGYDKEPLMEKLKIPDDYDVELMIIVGKKGKIEDLPDNLREREKPSLRKDLNEIVFEGIDGVKQL